MISNSLPVKRLAPGLALVLFSSGILAQPEAYYDSADATSPQALRESLHEIIDDHQRFPYTSFETDTWDILEIAQENPDDPNQIITIYRNASFPKQGGGNELYDREHSWPRSYGYPNDDPGNYPYTDMHALFLSDDDYNFARSNHPYAYCDAWFNPATSGQGFFIIVWENIQTVFLAWFTYDTERPAADVQAIIGDPGHRWITAQGTFTGDSATLDVYVTRGGVFDSAEPQVQPAEKTGTMQLHFSGCNAGHVSYDIPELNLSGTIPIQRVALDNVALCESLNAR
jgi:hypothetical protein